MRQGSRSRYLLALGVVVSVTLVLALAVLLGDAPDEQGRFLEQQHEERDLAALLGDPLPAATLLGSAAPTVRSQGGIAGIVHRGGNGIAARIELWGIAKRARHAPFEWDAPTGYLRRLDVVAAEQPLGSTRAAADGTFELHGLERGQYQVVATGPGGARTSLILDVPGDERVMAAMLALPEHTSLLKGRVRLENGKPWSGFVRVVPRAAWRPYKGHLPGDIPFARTDKQGAFELRGVPHGRVRLHAFRPGEVDVDGPELWVPHEQSVEFVAEEGIQWVRGRVLDDHDETPISGATLLAQLPDMSYRCVTNAEGEFRAAIPSLERCSAHYFIRAKGYSPATLDVHGGAKECVGLLSRAGRLYGRVVSLAGKPLGGLTVLAARYRAVANFPWGVSALTAADGSFSIPDAPAGKLSVRVRGRGFLGVGPSGALDEAVHVIIPRAGSAEVELRAASASRLAGYAMDLQHSPVPGAAVRVFEEVDDHPWQYLVVSEAASRSDGSFELPGLKEEATYTVEVTSPGYLPARTRGVRASQGLLVMILDQGRWLEVRVESEEGGPLSHAEVSAGIQDGDWLSTPVAPDGTVKIGPLPSTAVLGIWAHAPERLKAGVSVGVGAGGPVTIRLGRSHTISGTVRYWGDRPAKNVQVSIEGREEGASTDQEGAFKIQELPDGSYKLVVSVHSSRSWERVTATAEARAGDEGVMLRLEVKGPTEQEVESEREVTVRVLLPSGVPVPRADISYSFPHGRGGANVRGGTTKVPANTTTFTILRAESGSRLPLPVGPYRGGPIPEGLQEITVRLPPELRIEGRVVDLAGTGVAAARVSASYGLATTTDAKGRFRIGQLADRPYEVSVEPPYGYLSPEKVAAPAGTQGVTITLQASVRAAISVRDPGGEPLPGARVRVFLDSEVDQAGDAQEYDTEVTSDQHGVARPNGLRKDLAYHLHVAPPVSRQDLMDTFLALWRPQDSVVTLERELCVTGVVLDGDGRPVAGVDVGYTTSELDWHYAARTDAEGRFEVGGLHSGSVTLHAWFEGISTWRGPEPDLDVLSQRRGVEVTTRAGAENVTLRIDPGLPLTVRVANWPETEEKHRVTLFRQESSDHDGKTYLARYTATIGGDGVARFRNAPRDAAYTLQIGPIAKGLCALIRGVRPGHEQRSVTLKEGGVVRGTLRIPTEDWRGSVWLEGEDFCIEGKLKPDGAFEVRGVPPGMWTIQARAFSLVDGNDQAAGHGQRYAGSVQAEAGAEVEIQLRMSEER